MGRSRYKITAPKLPHFVKRGYVDEAVHWRYSSARNYAGQESFLGGVSAMVSKVCTPTQERGNEGV